MKVNEIILEASPEKAIGRRAAGSYGRLGSPAQARAASKATRQAGKAEIEMGMDYDDDSDNNSDQIQSDAPYAIIWHGQYAEWYGDSAPESGEGRYKMKGDAGSVLAKNIPTYAQAEELLPRVATMSDIGDHGTWGEDHTLVMQSSDPMIVPMSELGKHFHGYDEELQQYDAKPSQNDHHDVIDLGESIKLNNRLRELSGIPTVNVTEDRERLDEVIWGIPLALLGGAASYGFLAAEHGLDPREWPKEAQAEILTDVALGATGFGIGAVAMKTGAKLLGKMGWKRFMKDKVKAIARGDRVDPTLGPSIRPSGAVGKVEKELAADIAATGRRGAGGQFAKGSNVPVPKPKVSAPLSATRGVDDVVDAGVSAVGPVAAKAKKGLIRTLVDPRAIGAGAAVTLGREPGDIEQIDDYLPAYGYTKDISGKLTDLDRGDVNVHDIVNRRAGGPRWTGPNLLAMKPGQKEVNRMFDKAGVGIKSTGRPTLPNDPNIKYDPIDKKWQQYLKKQADLQK
jgi:hypothetical protein